MPIGYVNKAFVFNAAATASSIVPVPAGTTTGHRMLCFVCTMANAATITDPTGSTWAKLAEFAPGSAIKSAVYYRDATAGEPASYTWGYSGSSRNFGYAVTYSGCDLAVAPSASATVYNDTGDPGPAPALALGAGDWLATLAAGRQNPGTDDAKEWAIDDPGDAERFDFYQATTGTGAKLTGAWWDSNRALTAGTYQRSPDPSLALAQWHAWSVRLAVPAGAPPPPATPGAWSHMGVPIVR
jgi:hypothetical protein